MSYRDRLHPWCVIRCLPQAQTLILARFRKRNEAEAHLTALRRLVPEGRFELVFDAEVDLPKSPYPAGRLRQQKGDFEPFLAPVPSFYSLLPAGWRAGRISRHLQSTESL